jgi:hypothetical protein
VTRYAVDQERGALLAVWASGAGDLATIAALLPEGCDAQRARVVAFTLSGLSEAAWRTYTHPASAAGSLEHNSEGWRRQQERDAFTTVLGAIGKPELPERGMVRESLVTVTGWAHRVGRALHEIGDAGLADAVAREVEGELSAIERAELGDLTGRAVQAVVLSREDVSPVQVAAADALLRDRPFGDDRLFTEVDPASAAVAAAHWLQAAADVAASVSELDPVYVVAAADDIEALAHETPTVVLELMAEGASPREAVTALIRDALLVAEGLVPDAEGLVQAVEDALVQTERLREEEGLVEAVLAGIRATPLDPARPALDLLEDLLTGIHGCWLIYDEYAAANITVDHDGDEDDLDDMDDMDDMDDEEADTSAFLELVRVQAAEHPQRLQ